MDIFPFYLFYLDHFFGLGLEVGEQGRSQPDAVWQECPDPVLEGRNPAGSSVLPERFPVLYDRSPSWTAAVQDWVWTLLPYGCQRRAGLNRAIIPERKCSFFGC